MRTRLARETWASAAKASSVQSWPGARNMAETARADGKEDNSLRVPASEAEQMVRAVRDSGRTAWHLLGRNEGHGFAKKENQDYQFWVGLMFWQQNLLGERR